MRNNSFARDFLIYLYRLAPLFHKLLDTVLIPGLSFHDIYTGIGISVLVTLLSFFVSQFLHNNLPMSVLVSASDIKLNNINHLPAALPDHWLHQCMDMD